MSSVKEEFQELVNKVHAQIETSSLRQDSVEFQESLTRLIGEFLELKNIVHSRLALFSENEGFEDLSTASMPLLALDFHLGYLISKKQAVQLQNGKDRNVLKMKFLRKAVQCYAQFMMSLNNYGILDKVLSQKLDNFENVYEPKLQELYAQPSDSKDLSNAHLKRQQKIEAFQQTKRLEAQIKDLESRHVEDSGNDEELRELQKYQLKQTGFKAFNEIEQLLYELELLSNFSDYQPKISEVNNDAQLDSSAYTEKLETLNQPLLSKTGKVLRNFTLVDSRTQLKSKVFGYGQYAPTMSVEEFLEHELKTGRVLQGGEEEVPEPDEDNEEWQDNETYKKREWDDFTETHAKGSGNTLNRG